MNCLCGKHMKLIIREQTDKAGWMFPGQVLKDFTVWACPPEGCGRIYLESKGSEIGGTWYLAEVNNKRELL